MQKETIDNALSALQEAITYIVDDKIKKTNCDKTFFAIVVSIQTNGLYNVKLNNRNYTVPLISWRQPAIGDVVLFIAPCGNFTQAFIQ